MKNSIKYFAGIDVQINRGCCYYIVDENKTYVASGWIKENIPPSFNNLFLKLTNNNLERIAIGIDEPRMPLNKLRKREFDRKNHKWIESDSKRSAVSAK